MNKAILHGRLGQDPKMRYTQDEKPVCSFSLATDESYTNKDGEKVPGVEWHNITTFGRLAEVCAEHLTKGREVIVEGRIKTVRWEEKDGTKKRATQINAAKLTFIGTGGNGSKDTPLPAGGSYESPEQASDDYIPF